MLGRPIEFVSVTPEEVAQQSIELGTPDHFARAVRDLNQMFRTHRAAVLTHDVVDVTGVAPRTFCTWCEDHADAFA